MKKMKSKIFVFLAFFVLLMVLLSSYLIENYRNYSTTKEPQIEYEESVQVEQNVPVTEGYIPIIDENAHEILEKEYRITNLTTDNVYIQDNTLYLDFYFSSHVSRSDILAIRSLVLSKYIIEPNIISDLPYANAFTMGTNIQNINLSIYIDDNMIIRENFTNIEESLSIDYYEDIDMGLDLRSVENDALDLFSQRIIIDFQRIKKVDFEAPYKGNVVSIKINSSEKLSDKEIEGIKQIIEQDLASKVDFLGIVLLFYHDETKFLEVGLHNNSTNRYWFDEYWGNHQYFEYNTNQ